MIKIHQVIAVGTDVKGSFNKFLGETRHTLTGKAEHFEEHLKEYEPLNEADREQLDRDFKPMVDTVPSKLAFFEEQLARRIALVIQLESANAGAKADLVVKKDDGALVVMFADTPVSALVQLGNLMRDVKNQVYDNIPTLDPLKRWVPDPNREFVYTTDEIKRARTKKVQVPIELSPSTPQHKAQVQLVTEDVTTGHWIQKFWSGKISSKDKSLILKRVDAVLAGIKSATAVANEAEVPDVHIAAKVISFIRTGE